MFGLSFPELLIVMVVALVVLGPERLPKLAKTLGKAMREVRRTTSEFKDMVEGEFHALDREVERMPERKEGAQPEALPAPGVPTVRPAGAVPVAAADGAPSHGVDPAMGAALAHGVAPADSPAPAHTAEAIAAGGAPASTKDA